MKSLFIKQIIFLLVLILLSTNYIASYNDDYVELDRFCKVNGFTLYYYPTKSKIVLHNRYNHITLLVNSNLVIFNNRYAYYMHKTVRLYRYRLWVPGELVKIINKKNSSESVEEDIIPEKSDEKLLYNVENDYNKVGVIFIDAGHGGKDPGNCNNNLREKDIVLKVSYYLKQLLSKYLPDTTIYLIRDDDTYYKLSERTKKAIEKAKDIDGAGLFISVHANAALSSKAYGVETFYYSTDPKDITSRRLHYIENELDEYRKYSDDHVKLVSKLFDLQLSKESKLLAQYINDSLYKEVKSKTTNRGIKGLKPFYVIKDISMPSVLVEIGFLSNKKEAKLLRTKKYQIRCAKGITKGIIKFVKHFNLSKGFTQ